MLVLLGLPGTRASAQVVSTWNGGTGNWSNPLNWNNGVPNGNYNALITPASSTVGLDINATVANLTLASGDSLNIQGTNTLTLQSSGGSTINNSGTISVGPTAGIVVGPGNGVTLQGGGGINLSGGSITGATGTETFVNVDNTISGYGTISGLGSTSYAQQGDIAAVGGTLTIQTNAQGLSLWNAQVASNSTLVVTGGPINTFVSGFTGFLGAVNWNIQGTLQFDNANITSCGCNITLDGSGAKIINQFGQNALANLSNLNLTGTFFNIQNGATLTTNVDLTTAAGGYFNVLNSSSLSIGGTLTTAGTVNISSSTLNVNGDVNVEGGNPFASLNLSNSTVNVKGSFMLGQTYANMLDMSGSSLTVGGDFNIFVPLYGGNINIRNGSTLNIQGSLNNTAVPGVAPLISPLLVLSGGSTLTVQNALNNSSSVSLVTGSAGTVQGTLTNSGSIQIDKTSVLTVNGGYNQTAGTSLVDGLLNVGGTGVNILGGSLSGTGAINGNVLMSGILTPTGASPGTLSIFGNYQQTNTGVFNVLIDPFSQSLLSVSGNVTLDPGAMMQLSLLNGLNPLGQTFTLMDYFSLTGIFANGINFWDDGYFWHTTYGQNQISVTAIRTPEPGSFSLLAIGLMGLLLYLRRRRAPAKLLP